MDNLKDQIPKNGESQSKLRGSGEDEKMGNKKINFHHPYTPYAIQETFMQTVYDVLEKGEGQVGILESPTGTVGFRFLFI